MMHRDDKDWNGLFSIVVDYDKESPSPENIFIGIAKLIESFKLIDKQLIGCVDSDTETETLLDDIEKGSIKLWLRNTLKQIDDKDIEDLNYKRIAGKFLVKAKAYILKKCNDVNEIQDVEIVEDIETGLSEIAKESGINQLGCYTKPPREDLLNGLNKLGEAFNEFGEKNKIIFIGDDNEKVVLNTKFRLPLATLEEFCAGDVIENPSEIILKVRKPDFIGDTQWEFLHGREPIKAKISDEEWIKSYFGGAEIITPGDSLRVKMITTSIYNNNQDLIRSRHVITKVIAVVKAERVMQEKLLN